MFVCSVGILGVYALSFFTSENKLVKQRSKPLLKRKLATDKKVKEKLKQKRPIKTKLKEEIGPSPTALNKEKLNSPTHDEHGHLPEECLKSIQAASTMPAVSLSREEQEQIEMDLENIQRDLSQKLDREFLIKENGSTITQEELNADFEKNLKGMEDELAEGFKDQFNNLDDVAIQELENSKPSQDSLQAEGLPQDFLANLKDLRL